MSDEHRAIAQTLRVDAERVHVRHKLVQLEGITRGEFHGLVARLEGTGYRLSLRPPGTPLRVCNGNDGTFDALFQLYQKGSLDIETIRSLLADYDGDVPGYVWDLLAGDTA